MCFRVLMNRPERSLLGCLWSKSKFRLIVDINFNISGSLLFGGRIYIESLMSCHLLLNLLHELANMILCEALPSIISFLPTNVINLVINDNEFEILFIT